MHRRRSCRFVFIVLLLAFLVHPAWGATPGGQTLRAADLLDRLWSALTGIWAEAGCIADPHGSCASTPTAPGTDAGCIADPNGGCAAVQAEPPAPVPSTDEGCIADSNGGCAPRS
jgi:hypothetical protein